MFILRGIAATICKILFQRKQRILWLCAKKKTYFVATKLHASSKEKEMIKEIDDSMKNIDFCGMHTSETNPSELNMPMISLIINCVNETCTYREPCCENIDITTT